MQTPIIRPAKESDIPAVGRLLYQVHAIHHGVRPDLFKPGARKYRDDELKKIFADPKAPVFVAETDGKVLGYAFCIHRQFIADNNMTDVKTLYLDDLCVDESARGQHIGTALCDFVFGFAKQNGYYNVTLNVWADNKEALAFYRKIGLSVQKIGMEKIL